jgi:hypothetical protein
VLQAIVRDDDIALGIRGQQRTAGCNAIAPDGDRHLAAPCEQQRLVTDHTGVRISPDDLFTFSGTTVTTTDNPRPPTVRAQFIDEPEDERRLAASADRQIADDDNRNRQPEGTHDAERVQGATELNKPPEQPGQRQQRIERDRQRPLIPQPRQALSEIEETHQPLAGTDQLGDCVANEMCG